MEKLIFGIPIVDRYARSHDTGALIKDGCLNVVQGVRSDIFEVSNSIVVLSSFRADHHVAKILCELYSHLLDFHFRAAHLLRKGGVRNTAAVLWDDELTPLVTSFEETWQRLDSLVQQENVFSNRFLIDEALCGKGDTDLTTASQKCVPLTRCTFNLSTSSHTSRRSPGTRIPEPDPAQISHGRGLRLDHECPGLSRLAQRPRP